MSGPPLQQRQTEADGATVETFALPTDEASLEALLRELFCEHWREITFGPLIQGAAWEMRAPHAPTYFGMLDGYLTVAFGVSHFHLCIGLTAPRHRRPHAAHSCGGSHGIGVAASPCSLFIPEVEPSRRLCGPRQFRVNVILPLQ
jgi:hypothetical protein